MPNLIHKFTKFSWKTYEPIIILDTVEDHDRVALSTNVNIVSIQVE